VSHFLPVETNLKGVKKMKQSHAKTPRREDRKE
jgi:hypothetical protein